MEQQFYPYYDGDVQTKVKAELGEDKMVVFNPDTNTAYLAQKIGDRHVIDINDNQYEFTKVLQQMEEGLWQRKSS